VGVGGGGGRHGIREGACNCFMVEGAWHSRWEVRKEEVEYCLNNPNVAVCNQVGIGKYKRRKQMKHCNVPGHTLIG